MIQRVDEILFGRAGCENCTWHVSGSGVEKEARHHVNATGHTVRVERTFEYKLQETRRATERFA